MPTCYVCAHHLACTQRQQHQARVARQNLPGKPRGVESVIEAGEEHHGQEQNHPGVAQHLQHAQNLLAKRPLLTVDGGTVSDGRESCTFVGTCNTHRHRHRHMRRHRRRHRHKYVYMRDVNSSALTWGQDCAT
jgi:hypothetical protein